MRKILGMRERGQCLLRQGVGDGCAPLAQRGAGLDSCPRFRFRPWIYVSGGRHDERYLRSDSTLIWPPIIPPAAMRSSDQVPAAILSDSRFIALLERFEFAWSPAYDRSLMQGLHAA